MSTEGPLETTYTARGLKRYQMEIWHDELNKYQMLKGTTESEVLEKADAKCAQWDEMWDKQVEREEQKINISNKKEHAKLRTLEAISEIQECNEILINRKKNGWKSLIKKKVYNKPLPMKIKYPKYPLEPEYPEKPNKSDKEYKPKIGILDELFSNRKKDKIKEKELIFQSDLKDWKKEIKNIKSEYEEEINFYDQEKKKIDKLNKNNLMRFIKEKEIFFNEIEKDNNEILSLIEEYKQGDKEIVEQFISKILDKSKYPENIDFTYELEYNPLNKILIIDYQLPPEEDIPKLKEVKYIQNRDDFDEKYLSKTEFNKLYDSILYQIPLRVTFEIYHADKSNMINSLIFNGYVNSTDPSTGIKSNSCIISLQTQKNEFNLINLDNVDPKACFRKLKGIGSSKLHTITPIKPLLEISKEDKRFIEGYDVESNLENGYNIAAMDWKDFENMVRELFEKEFSKEGGEVKVTQSSRDGGVDAVAFDNDPIRGGKIVIQAKRYTNTVGVSAVRDLYGTVMNEGAMKGILITTADYGPDAYAFAKDKPISLLNGGHLLHMLRNHGHTVKIDLKEAKGILSEND